MEALQRANVVRYGRRDVKNDLANGSLDLRDALGDDRVKTMAVHKLLASMRGWGPVRAMELLSLIDINAFREIGNLTERERDLIADYAPLTPKERQALTCKRELEQVLEQTTERGWNPTVTDFGILVFTPIGSTTLTDLEDLQFLEAELRHNETR
jgi:hypothetical protein